MVNVESPNTQISKLIAQINALYANNKENTNVANAGRLSKLIKQLKDTFGIDYDPASSENKRISKQNNPAKKSTEKSLEKSSEKYSEKSSEKSMKKTMKQKKKPDENKKNYSATRANEEAIEDIGKMQNLVDQMNAALDENAYTYYFNEILEIVRDIQIENYNSSKLIGKIKKLKKLVENFDKLRNDRNKKMTEEKRQKLNKNYSDTFQKILSNIENLDQNKKKTNKAKTQPARQANNNSANINDDLFIETRNIMQGLEKKIRSTNNPEEYLDYRNELLNVINQLKTDKTIYSQKLNNKIVTIKTLVKRVLKILLLPQNEENQNSYYKIMTELGDKIQKWDESGYCDRGTRWHKKTEKCLNSDEREEYENTHPKRKRCPDGKRRFQGRCVDYDDDKSKKNIRPLDEFRKVRHFLPENAYLPEKAIHPNYKFRADDYAEKLKELDFITPKKRYNKKTRKLRNLGPNDKNDVKEFIGKNKKLREHAETDNKGKEFRATNKEFLPQPSRIHRFKYKNDRDSDDSDDDYNNESDDDDTDDEKVDFDNIRNRNFGISDDGYDYYDTFENTQFDNNTGTNADVNSFIKPTNQNKNTYDLETNDLEKDIELFGIDELDGVDELDTPESKEFEIDNTNYLKKKSGGNTQKKSLIGKTKKRNPFPSKKKNTRKRARVMKGKRRPKNINK
jgi:hypothetical protein